MQLMKWEVYEIDYVPNEEGMEIIEVDKFVNDILGGTILRYIKYGPAGGNSNFVFEAPDHDHVVYELKKLGYDDSDIV